MALSKQAQDIMIDLAAGRNAMAMGHIRVALNKEKTDTARQSWEKVLQTIECQEAQRKRLPTELNGMLTVEDTAETFNPARYYPHRLTEEVLQNILAADATGARLREMGIYTQNATLLSGESGTGKTMFGRYVAHKMNLPFAYVNFSTAISSLLGATGKNLSTIFRYAEEHKCVLMLDEIDAIGRDRASSGNDVGEMNRITIVLMQQIDRMRSGTILLGATNVLGQIDSALIRRFRFKAEFAKIKWRDIDRFAEVFFKGTEFHDGENWHEIVRHIRNSTHSSMQDTDISQADAASLLTKWAEQIVYRQITKKKMA